MRKISVGNKSRFAIFTIIIIAIIIILLVGVRTTLGMEKPKYNIEKGSLIYDIEYSPIKLEQDATMREKWDGNYYLTEGKNEEVSIGKHGVVYKQSRRALELYGKFFEIDKNGAVTKMTEKTEINDTSKDTFFKLDDRKYLIISRNITNTTRSLSTKDYLLIVLDKAGNAQIMNHEVNAKILNQTFIDTPTFQFDIANEKLIFADNTLDLKKIIGSTNEYKEKDNKQPTANQTVPNNTNQNQINQENNLSTNGNGGASTGEETIIQVDVGGSSGGGSSTITTISGGTNTGTTISGNSSKSSSNSSNNNKTQSLDKSVTLNSVTSGVSHIDVNYYIVDPQGQYKAVYLLVDGGNNSRTIALDKGATSYRITGLESNTEYKITLGTKGVNSRGETVDIIEDVIETKTLKNQPKLQITKIASGRIYFTLKLDQNYIIDSGNLVMYVDGQKQETAQINLQSAYTNAGWSSSFKYVPGSQIILKTENVYYNGDEVPFELYAKTRN